MLQKLFSNLCNTQILGTKLTKFYISRKSSSGLVKMIQEVNEEEGRKFECGNLSSAGSKQKRRRQSEERNNEAKRVKLDGSFASEIFQIGARGGEKEFKCYILPRGVIDWGVTKFVNGIKVAKSNNEGGGRRLVDKDRQLIASQGPKQGLESFLTWIEQEKREAGHTSAILVSHGSSDMPALLNNIAREGLEERFNESVEHFADSLSYFQQFHGDWGKHGMASLSKRLLPGEDFKPHDAGEDARMLHLCLRAAAGSILLPRLLTKAITVEQAWLRARRMLEKTLKKNEKRKNKTSAILFNAIK